MIEQIQKTNTAHQASSLWRSLGRILLLLAGTQALRAAIIWVQYTVFRPAPNSVTWVWMEIAAYLLVGALLLIVFRPSAQSLGLSWRDMRGLERTLTILFGVIYAALVLTSLTFSPEMLLVNLQTAVLIPVFEELIFRGWAWKTLQSVIPGKHSGLLTWLVVALLFSLWHLGYMDSYLLKALPANPNLQMDRLLLIKLLTTLFYGLVIGLFRWRTGRVFGSIWVHGLINLFGR